MTEADTQALSILLPTSGVSVFSKDKETLEAAKNISADWRFARVKIEVQEGDVITATQAYKDAESPDLVIIQTENIEDSLTGQLEDLAGNCDEGTAAIVIGPVNDVYLYRKLIDMGVSDYLVKPVSSADMADVIAKTLIERIGVKGSRLIAFVGAKGGVGTSVLAEGAAWGVSEILDQKTILIDGSGGWSTLGVGMGFEPSTTLLEAAKAAANDDEDSLKRMLHTASDKLDVLASGGDVMLEQTLKSDQFEELIDMLMAKYPVVIADLSHTAPELEKAVLVKASQIVIVSTPTLPALRLARSLIQEIKEVRGGEEGDVEMIVNMQGLAAANEVSKGDIEKAMEFQVSSTIAFMPKTFIGCENESRKVTSDADGMEVVRKSILPVLQKVLSVHIEETGEDDAAKEGLLDGFMSKLKAK